MRAGLYMRVSTGHQTTDNQRIELDAYCKRQGWKVVKVYDDSGVSGVKTSRSGLDLMMKDAAEGRLDVVICWKLDRMGRSVSNLLDILQRLESAGVGFVSTTQQIDTTTAMGRMVTTLLAAISAFERELIVERVKCGISRKRAENPSKPWGRPRVAIDVKRAVKLRSEGLGYKQVAKRLGVPRTTLYRTLKAIPQTPAALVA